MPSFTINTEQSAVSKPEIILNGKSFKGELLSIEEFVALEPLRLKTVESNTMADLLAYARAFFYGVFPKKLFRKDIVPIILKQPNLVEVLGLFLENQTRAMGSNVSKTGGTN